MVLITGDQRMLRRACAFAQSHQEQIFIHNIPCRDAPYEIWLQQLDVFLGREVWKSWIWVILDKVNEWRWPWVVINRHVIICLNIFTNLYRTGFNSFSEIYSWSIFPYKSKREQIWPCCKIGQCQSRVIIQMWLYSSNQCCLPSFKVIGLLVPEKIFKVFTIYGHGAHLGHVT